jgi:murein DD-endopeptidase MepM/ murein hydrolase activator NlpD
MRKHPIYGDYRFHHGVDIAAPEGTPIYPAMSGRVIFSGEEAGYGNIVVVDHRNGYITKYAHNRVNLVKEGDHVDAATVIAEVGNSGVSTGPHLHFEARYKDKSIDPIEVLAMR